MVSIPIPWREQARSGDGPVAVALRSSWLHATRLGRATSSALFFGGQVLLLALLYMIYRMGRRMAVGREPQALANARDVWNVERLLDLPSESAIQQLALHSTHLLELANRFYIGVHFPASITFLLWVLVRHRDAWPRVRLVILASTSAALLIHMLYPLAPPRFLPQVMPHVTLVDTGAVFGPTPYTAGDTVANQYAAMPSLHVGWSILVAWGVITILRTRARWVILAHPVITIIVVVITANHYWMDGVIGGGLVAIAVQLSRPSVRTRLACLATGSRRRLRPTRDRTAATALTSASAGIRSVPRARQESGRPVTGLPEQRLLPGPAERAVSASSASSASSAVSAVSGDPPGEAARPPGADPAAGRTA
ncbi:phosphatase PAP2 family protein [Frankia sp. Cpl3]|nr:phosphatase PAP2 family protein [Frankia sp. Cpl3]